MTRIINQKIRKGPIMIKKRSTAVGRGRLNASAATPIQKQSEASPKQPAKNPKSITVKESKPWTNCIQ